MPAARPPAAGVIEADLTDLDPSEREVVAGFLAPVPILMLHIVEALVQAYIFGMLALIYVAGGLQSQQLRQQKKE